jgi:hypothetical protein
VVQPLPGLRGPALPRRARRLPGGLGHLTGFFRGRCFGTVHLTMLDAIPIHINFSEAGRVIDVRGLDG